METESRSPAKFEGSGFLLPSPTAAPLYLALGFSLVFAGLVTHILVSVVGGLFVLVGAVGWWRQVLPYEVEVRVPAQPEAQRPPVIQPRPGAVEHLVLGEGGHRVRLPVEYKPYRAGLRGGFYGGIAMAAVACTYGLVVHQSLWLPVNLLASVAMPSMVPSDMQLLLGFDAAAFVLASVGHICISLGVGLVYAAILPMLPGKPRIWGGIVAPVIWSGLAWTVVESLSPALAAWVSWPVFVLSQIVFGVVAGAVVAGSDSVQTLQSAPLAARVGLEVAGVDANDGESGP